MEKLGETFLDAGLLTENQLSQALVNHKKANMKLGQYLINEGIVSELKMVTLLAKQMGFERYQPETYPVDRKLSKYFQADIARKYQAVPLTENGALLKIAMTDPLDIKALEAIETAANIEVEAVICTDEELNVLINRLYGTYSELDDVLNIIEATQNEEEKGPKRVTATEDVEVSSLQGMAEEAPVVRLVNSILFQSIRENASDVHLCPEKDSVQLRFRVDGKLHEVPAPPASMFLPIVSRLKLLSNMDIAISLLPQDGRFTVKVNNREINIRTSTIPTIHGENMIFRLLDTGTGIYALDRLGISESDREKIQSTIKKPYGMIISSGPTGSGKTTSLYSILKHINTPDINIVTLEDPVEFRIDKIRQIQLNRKAGITFATGLRAVLRQDPDVIMVGEIRDTETAGIAVQAALTGHRVLSTVHTNDAAGAIIRLVDMGIEPYLVSSVMLVSIAQRLVRKVCPHCKDPYKPPREVLKIWGLEQHEEAEFVQARGCFHCMDTGYKGRTGIFEVLIIDEMVQDMILKEKSAKEITLAAQQVGNHRSLKVDAAQKILKGITTIEEAASAVMM